VRSRQAVCETSAQGSGSRPARQGVCPGGRSGAVAPRTGVKGGSSLAAAMGASSAASPLTSFRRRPGILVLIAALAAVFAGPVGARGAEQPVAVSVQAAPGQTVRARAALAAAGLAVQRAHGSRLQVAAPASRIGAIDRLAGVASAGGATPSFADAITSEAVDRSGVPGLRPLAQGGRGVVIAILDQGFGTLWPLHELEGELPAPQDLLVRSFDLINGLAGTDAYDEPTDHGDLVAQTVYDFAPDARYIFVNYHTDQDFLAAVDWLIGQRPDIVVHSNNFIEGPFDGTSPAAQAVDRAAAAGILWFNSAGNYGLRHWSGPWQDANGDGVLDWPVTPGWTFGPPAPRRDFGQRLSFALSWTQAPSAPPTDLDLFMDQQQPDGSWATVAASRDRQTAGAPPAERITGFPTSAGVYRLRVVLASGPPPPGDLTLFSREVPLAAIGGTARSSIPTPADAAGSISVGAVDWATLALQGFSSQGPTADGRLKPDVVGMTNTLVVRDGYGPREAGGTSIAAPNAAGAAAILLAAERARDPAVSTATVRADLTAQAQDLGPPGPDDAYGAGLVRLLPPGPGAPVPDPAAPAADGWSPPQVLSADAGADQPALAVGAGGQAVAVWRGLAGGASGVRASVLGADGTWSSPLTISGAETAVRDPDVAVSAGGGAVAVWTATRGSQSVVQAAMRPAGGTWSAPQDLSLAARAALTPRVAVDAAGDAVVVWVDLQGLDEAIQAATLPAGGAWSPPEDLSPAGSGDREGVLDPRVAVAPSGQAVAVWTHTTAVASEIAASSRPAGGQWSAPQTLSQADQAAVTAQVAVDDAGDTVAAWTRFDGQQRRFEAQAAERTPDGVWSLPEPLSSPAQAPFEGSQRPRVALDPTGRATAAWIQTTGDGAAVMSAERAGGAWSVPVAVAGGLGEAGALRLAAQPTGGAVATWTTSGAGGRVVEAAVRDAGGAWAAPAPLSAAGAAAPSLASGGGLTAVLWQQPTAAGEAIEVRAHTAAT